MHADVFVCVGVRVYMGYFFFIELPSHLCHLHMFKLIKLYMLNMHSALYINYTQ